MVIAMLLMPLSCVSSVIEDPLLIPPEFDRVPSINEKSVRSV